MLTLFGNAKEIIRNGYLLTLFAVFIIFSSFSIARFLPSNLSYSNQFSLLIFHENNPIQMKFVYWSFILNNYIHEI